MTKLSDERLAEYRRDAPVANGTWGNGNIAELLEHISELDAEVANLKRQLETRDLEETVLLRKASELAENFDDGDYEYETSVAVEILRLKAASAYPRLDAYVQEKITAAVIQASQSLEAAMTERHKEDLEEKVDRAVLDARIDEHTALCSACNGIGGVIKPCPRLIELRERLAANRAKVKK